LTGRLSAVEQDETRIKTMRSEARHYERIAAPALHAGVGNALRHVYAPHEDRSAMRVFDDLLARLN